jgi:superfamily II DNA or RNA helicase
MNELDVRVRNRQTKNKFKNIANRKSKKEVKQILKKFSPNAKYKNKQFDPVRVVLNKYSLSKSKSKSNSSSRTEIDASRYPISPDTRYYTNVPNKDVCHDLDGHWNYQSIDRQNPYDKTGVCWTTLEDKQCSVHDNPELLRKLNATDYIKHKHSKHAKHNCEKTSKCVWDENECISKNAYKRRNIKYIPREWPVDITTAASYETIQKLIKTDERIKMNYSQLLYEGNRCTQAIKSDKKLTLPQTTIGLVARGISNNTSSKNRGLLVWHSTGSGKTITSMAIIDSFWDSDKRIVCVTSIEGLSSNPPKTFYENALDFFPRFNVQGDSREEKLLIIEEMFKYRKIVFMTYAVLAHYIQIHKPVATKNPQDKENHEMFLSNAILIMDEVQNIFKPLPNQREEHFALKKFFLAPENKKNMNMKMFILTATPGDTIDDTISLLNMIRDRSHNTEIKLPNMSNPDEIIQFKNSISGLISYYNASSDKSRFPHITEDNFYRNNFMERAQFEKYVEVFNSVKKNITDFDELQKKGALDKYYNSVRKYSNSLFNYDPANELSFFSAKLPKLLETIRKYPDDKHYIYSAFHENRGYGSHGARMIGKFLETELGFLRVKNAEHLSKLSPDHKGYALIINNELTSNTHKKELVSMFNIRNNNFNILVASQGHNEGLDLRGVRHIHIFEPLLTYNAEKQTIGRAVRNCSHSDLPYEQWTVKIHRYFTELPADLEQYNIAPKRVKLLELKRHAEELGNVIDENKGKGNEVLKKKQEETKLELAELKKSLKKAEKMKNAELSASLAAEIAAKETAIKDVKGNAKQQREDAKSKLLLAEKEVKSLEKEIKAMGKLNVESVIAIDDKIYTESLERVIIQNQLFTLMKESAIDCGLLQKFHAQSNEQIKCGTDSNESIISPVEKQIQSYKRELVRSNIQTPVFRYKQFTPKKRKSKKMGQEMESSSLSNKNSASWHNVKSRKNRR